MYNAIYVVDFVVFLKTRKSGLGKYIVIQVSSLIPGMTPEFWHFLLVLTALPKAEHSPDRTKRLSMKPEIPTDQKHTRAAVTLCAIAVFRTVRSATLGSLNALRRTKAVI